MLAPETWVPLAEVARPHGIRGELRLRLFNRDSDFLLSLDEVLLRFPDGEEHEVSVDGARRSQDAILMKLYSVDDRNRAEDLRGALVCARRGDLPPLADDEFYACDVEGARVVVEASPGDPVATTDVGVVRALRSYPGADVLVVDASDGGAPYEVPLVDAIVRTVDVAGGAVVLRTLEGVGRG